MGVLLLSHPQPPEPIVRCIKALDPDLEIVTQLEEADPGRIECVVAYRLMPGVLSRFPRLRLLCAASSGVEKLLAVPDLPPDLPVVRVTDPLQAAQIGQYVCGHAISHVRQFASYAEQQRNAQWLRHAPAPYGSAFATVLGLGHTGATIARMLGSVGFQVRGWSRSGRPVEGVEVLPDRTALAAALAQTDVLVCTLPTTAQTENLIDAGLLAQSPAKAMLINVGRGEVIDDAALAQALEAGRLAAAVLDVHRREPLPSDAPQWRTRGLQVMPHVASQPSSEAVARTVVEAMRRLRHGEPHPNLVERALGY